MIASAPKSMPSNSTDIVTATSTPPSIRRSNPRPAITQIAVVTDTGTATRHIAAAFCATIRVRDKGKVAMIPSVPSSFWPAIHDAPYPIVIRSTINGRKFAYRFAFNHPEADVSEPLIPKRAAKAEFSDANWSRPVSCRNAGYNATITTV